MAIPLNTGGGTQRPPALALKVIGQYIDAAVINVEQAEAYVFGTAERAVTKFGKPKMKEIITVLVIRGTGVYSKDNAEPQPGDVGCIYIEGQDKWDPDMDKTRQKDEFKSWSSALNDRGNLMVGDVIRWQYERDMQGLGAVPRKIRIFKVRASRPEEAAQTARCEQLHATPTALVTAGVADEEPF